MCVVMVLFECLKFVVFCWGVAAKEGKKTV